MPRIVNGLPVDTNASDCMDSARLAGMMALAKMPTAPDCTAYIDDYFGGLGVRHPNPEPKDVKASSWVFFSRDQTICLAAGLKAQSYKPISIYNYIIKNGNKAQNFIEDDGSRKTFGGDYCLPHVVGAMAIAAGVQTKLTILQSCFMVIDIIGNALFTPMREQNQLIALCYLTGYLKLYKRLTPNYKNANLKYWYDTTPRAYNRGELDVANAINNFVEFA